MPPAGAYRTRISGWPAEPGFCCHAIRFDGAVVAERRADQRARARARRGDPAVAVLAHRDPRVVGPIRARPGEAVGLGEPEELRSPKPVGQHARPLSAPAREHLVEGHVGERRISLAANHRLVGGQLRAAGERRVGLLGGDADPRAPHPARVDVACLPPRDDANPVARRRDRRATAARPRSVIRRDAQRRRRERPASPVVVGDPDAARTGERQVGLAEVRDRDRRVASAAGKRRGSRERGAGPAPVRQVELAAADERDQ